MVTRQWANHWVARAAGVASLLAAATVMSALLPPFVSQACPGCSASYAAGLPGTALRASPDAWAVVWMVGILAATAVLFLAGVAARLMAMVSCAASLAALGLSIFEGAVAFPRLLAPAELVPGMPASYMLGPSSYVLGPGYYLFLIGAAAAVGAATAMLVVGGDGGGIIEPRALASPRVVAAAGWACLVSLAAGFAGAFLPFALSCGGFVRCPAFVGPAPGSYSSAMVASADGRIVLALLVAAALATTARLAGRWKPLASSAALLLSLAAAVLVSFDSLNGATRVLGWPVALPVSPELGYYLLQVGSVAAVLLALLLVAADRPAKGFRSGVGLRAREAALPA